MAASPNSALRRQFVAVVDNKLSLKATLTRNGSPFATLQSPRGLASGLLTFTSQQASVHSFSQCPTTRKGSNSLKWHVFPSGSVDPSPTSGTVPHIATLRFSPSRRNSTMVLAGVQYLVTPSTTFKGAFTVFRTTGDDPRQDYNSIGGIICSGADCRRHEYKLTFVEDVHPMLPPLALMVVKMSLDISRAEHVMALKIPRLAILSSTSAFAA